MNAMLNSRWIRVLTLMLTMSFLSVGCTSKSEKSTQGAASESAAKSQSQASQAGLQSKSQPRAAQAPVDKASVPALPRTIRAPKTAKLESEAKVDAAPAAPSASISTTPVLSEWPKTTEGLDLLAVAAVRSLNALEEVISLVNGAPKSKGDIATEAVADFKKKFGFKDASWLRKDAPMYVLLSDIKEQDGGRGLVVPIGDQKAFKKALKGFKKKGSSHLGELTADGGKAYVDSVGDQAVITYKDDFFSRLKPYLEGPFKSYKTRGVVELRLNVQVLRSMYGNELSGSKDWIKKSMADLMSLDNVQGAKGKSLEDLVDLLQSFVQSVSEASFALTLDKNDMSILCELIPEKGQTLERMVTSMATLRSGLTASIHPNALIAFGGRTDSWTPEEGSEQSEELISRVSSIVPMEAREKNELKTHIDTMFKNQTGDGLFQIYQDGEFPLSIGFVAGLKDSEAERKAHQGVIGVAFKLLMKNLKTRMKDNRMASLFLNSKSFGQLFGSMSILTTPMGIGLEVSSNVSQGTVIDNFTVKMDWKKSPLVARMPNADMVQKVVGDSLSIAAAYRGQRGAIAFGPNAIEHAKKMVEDKGFGGTNSLVQTLVNHAVAGEVRLASIAKLLLKYTDNRTPPLLAMSAMDNKMALHLKAKSDGSKVMFRLSVPAPLFRAFR